MASDSEVAIRISARNEASAALRKVASDLDDLGGAAQRTVTRSERLGTAFRTIDTQTQGLQRGIDRGIFAFGAAGVAAGVYGIKTVASFEQSEAAITRFVGAGAGATQFLGDLQTFAVNTPFTLQGLTETTQRMLGLGFAAKDIIPTLTAVGDAAAGVGAGQDGVDRIVRALGQIRSKGRVQGDELLQLNELGIDAQAILARGLNVNPQQLQRLLQQGQVSADKAIPILVAGMERRFNGVMDVQSKTLNGMLSNLQDTLQIRIRDAIDPQLPAIKAQIPLIGDALGAALKDLAPAIPVLIHSMLDLIPVLIDTAPAMVTVATAAAQVAGAIAPVITTLDRLPHGLEIALAGLLGFRVLMAAGGAVQAVTAIATALRGLAAAEVAVNAVGGVNLPTGGKVPTSVARTGIRGVADTVAVRALYAGPAAGAAAAAAAPAAFGALAVATPALAAYYGDQMDKNNLVQLGSARDYARTTNAIGQQTPNSPFAVYREQQLAYNNRFAGSGIGSDVPAAPVAPRPSQGSDVPMAPSALAPRQGTGELLRPVAPPAPTVTFGDTKITINNPKSTVDVQKGVRDGFSEYLNERNRRG